MTLCQQFRGCKRFKELSSAEHNITSGKQILKLDVVWRMENIRQFEENNF